LKVKLRRPGAGQETLVLSGQVWITEKTELCLADLQDHHTGGRTYRARERGGTEPLFHAGLNGFDSKQWEIRVKPLQRICCSEIRDINIFL
jgi:hypothetical protein